jgi:hypothetical protein
MQKKKKEDEKCFGDQVGLKRVMKNVSTTPCLEQEVKNF